MKKIDVKQLISKPFMAFDHDWALLTAGSVDNHNSMTISWGEMGTLWSKNVVTVYVKPVRFTYKFMENNELFVVSFFKEEYRKALQVMGSISGRNHHKDQEAHLTSIDYHGLTIYEEAYRTIICKKIYQQDLDINNIPSEVNKTYYQKEQPHRMYIGEVLEILENN